MSNAVRPAGFRLRVFSGCYRIAAEVSSMADQAVSSQRFEHVGDRLATANETTTRRPDVECDGWSSTH